MASKRFCFNPTLLGKNLLRFWPCWAATLLLGILLLPVNLYDIVSRQLANNRTVGIDHVSEITLNLTPVVILSAFCLGCIVAVLLSKYLFTARSANFFHALPIRREGLMLTNIVSGLMILWAPMLLTAGVTLLVESSFGLVDAVSLGQLLLLYLSASTLFFGMAMVCMQLTGMAFAGIGLYVVVNFVAYGLYLIFSGFSTLLIPGYAISGDETLVQFLTPVVNLIDTCIANYVDWPDSTLSRLSGLHLVGIYAAVGVVLLAAALLIYRIRHSEHAGDLLAFNYLRPVFKVLFSLGLGAAAGLATVGAYGFTGFLPILLSTLAWSLVFWLIAEMLVRKSVRVFRAKSFAQWAGVAVCLAVILFALNIDLFGIANRVPDISEVDSVVVGYNRSVLLEDEDGIAMAIALHQTVLDDYEAPEDEYSNLRFDYQLKNGKTLRRSYRIPYKETVSDLDSAERALYDFLYDPDVIMGMYFEGPLTDPSDILNMYINYYNGESYEDLTLTSEQAWQVYQALVDDICIGNFPAAQQLCQSEYKDMLNVDISLHILRSEQDASDYPDGYIAAHHANIQVSELMFHTIDCLKSLGCKIG